MEMFIVVLLILALVTAVCLPLVLYVRLIRSVKAETSQFISHLDRNLAATVKLLEVRDYYEKTSAALKKMLQEAYKEGNRFRQDEIRKLIDRLDALKVRTVDKQVRILDSEGRPPSKKRRSRSRKPRRHNSGNASKTGPSPGTPGPPRPDNRDSPDKT